jgi:hypothetical protein
MAYARMYDSDVYVFSTDINGSPAIYCCGCSLEQGMEQMGFVARRTQDMIDHLVKHQEAGDRMPETILDEIRTDDAENFPVRPT